MAISRRQTTVFTDDCQLVKVRTRPDLFLGQEIQLDAGLEKVRSASPVRTTAHRRLIPAMAAVSLFLVVAVSLLFSQGLIFNPVYARISVDVNPSVEFSLNRDLNVIAVKAQNQDAAKLLDEKRYQGIAWQTALEQWVEEMRQAQQFQIQNMLISAVLPDSAELLKTRILSLEGAENPGIMHGINVRVIFSYDQAVARQALRNNLSIGRQMLLNQAQLQNMDLNKTSIETAPLGDLIQTLLQKGQPDQTRLTERSTQSLSDPTDQPGGSSTQETARETERETHRETSGSTQGSSDGSQQTSRQTERETNRETSGSSDGSSDGSQQTSQETRHETTGEISGSSDSSSDHAQGTQQPGDTQQTSGSQQSGGTQQTSGTQQPSGSQPTSGTQQTSGSQQTSGTQQTSGSSQGGGNGGN